MKTSTFKLKVIVLEVVVWPHRVGGELLLQVEELQYLGVLFKNEERIEYEIDRQIGAAAPVTLSICCSEDGA